VAIELAISGVNGTLGLNTWFMAAMREPSSSAKTTAAALSLAAVSQGWQSVEDTNAPATKTCTSTATPTSVANHAINAGQPPCPKTISCNGGIGAVPNGAGGSGGSGGGGGTGGTPPQSGHSGIAGRSVRSL
jgi:hypothetical protein